VWITRINEYQFAYIYINPLGNGHNLATRCESKNMTHSLLISGHVARVEV